MTTLNNLPSIFVPLVGLVFPALAMASFPFPFKSSYVFPRPCKTPKN